MNERGALCKRRGPVTQLWERDVEHLCRGHLAANKKGGTERRDPFLAHDVQSAIFSFILQWS